MLFTSEGVKPDPEKVIVLETKPPKDKDELKYFNGMIQSNGDFIPGFAKVLTPLRTLLNEKGFYWTHMYQKHLINFSRYLVVICCYLTLI